MNNDSTVLSATIQELAFRWMRIAKEHEAEVTRLRAALATVSEERDAALQEADSRKSALVGICHFIARQVAASISVVEEPSE
jgi:hypothetical protein